MKRVKKSFLLTVLFGVSISFLMHAQEEKTAKPMVSLEQVKAVIEETEKKAKEFRSMAEQLAKERLEREQLRRKLKPLWITIHTLQVSLGVLIFYLANFYKAPTADPNVMAQRAIPRRYVFSTGGIISIAGGLYGLYEELDIPGQIKRLLKLLKQEDKK